MNNITHYSTGVLLLLVAKVIFVSAKILAILSMLSTICSVHAVISFTKNLSNSSPEIQSIINSLEYD